MSQLTGTQVRHIAKLARLRLSDAEVETFPKQLSSILNYVDMLQEVDTSKTEPTAQVTGLSTILRPDDLWKETPTREELLGTTGLPIVDHQIETPSAHG